MTSCNTPPDPNAAIANSAGFFTAVAKDVVTDTLIDLVAKVSRPLSGMFGAVQGVEELLQEVAEGLEHSTPVPRSYGNESAAATLMEMSHRMKITSSALGIISGATAITGIEIIAAPTGVASLTLSALADGAELLAKDLILLDPGQTLSCPPPSPLPYPDSFLHPPISPLVFDLNNNGIEATNYISSTVHFDLNADGFAERTGWISPGDGILVYDADANGKIDNGHELFGNNADNGFDVLAFYDGRTGGNFYTDASGGEINFVYRDQVIDAGDEIYSSLNVWQDANQDGVAQSTELTSLSDLNIESIDLTYDTVNTDVNGNTIRQVSTATTSGAASINVADVWLATDGVSTVFAGEQPAVDALKGLPDLHGHGVVKSLHLAMADDVDLLATVQDFIADAEGLDVMGLLQRFQGLLFQWAGVANVDPTSHGEYSDARIVEFMENIHGQEYLQLEGINAGTDDPGPMSSSAMSSAFVHFSSVLLVEFLSQVTDYHLSAVTADDFQASRFDGLYASFVYNPEAESVFFSADMFARQFVGLDMSDDTAVDQARQLIDLAGFISKAVDVPISEFTATLYDAFEEAGADEAAGLIAGMHFYEAAYTPTNGLLITPAGADAGYSVVDEGATVAESVGSDLYFVGRDLGAVTFQSGQSGAASVDGILLSTEFTGADYTVAFDPTAGTLTIDFGDLGTSLVLENYITTTTQDDAFSTYNNPFVVDAEGHATGYSSAFVGDQVRFTDGTVWTGDDLLEFLALNGTSGDDTLTGYFFAQTLSGGEGNDVLVGGAEDDTFIGGAGDDSLGDTSDMSWGGVNDGADLYIFNPGDGVDEIRDARIFFSNTIQLNDTITADLVLARDGDDLVITFTGRPEDSIRVVDMFTLEAISLIQTDDGTLSYQQISDIVVLNAATPGDDTITGFDASDTIAGGLGDDILQGSPGTFSSLPDTFVYRMGDGNDRITANYTDGTDTLRLTDIASTDVTVTRSGSDAVLSFAGGGSVTLVEQFDSLGWSVLERVEFADQVVWTEADIALRLASVFTSPSITGANGGVEVDGTSAADGIKGGTGDDVLKGGVGGDTYFFGVGSGLDVIEEGGAGAHRDVDLVRLESSPQDVTATRDGEDIILMLSAADSLTIKNFFVSSNRTTHDDGSSIEFIEFADNTRWGVDQIIEHAWIRGTASPDTLTGSRDSDTLHGAGGDDALDGGIGSDTYVIAVGDGHDTITDDSGTTGVYDQIIFKGVDADSIVVTRVIDNQNADDMLTVSTLDGETSITFEHFFYDYGVDKIIFDDATLSLDDVLAIATLPGTPGVDQVEGSPENDVIQGNGDDDTMFGGDGYDTYVWSRGDGDDTIVEFQDLQADGGRLVLHNVDPGSVQLTRVAADSFDWQRDAIADLKVTVLPLNTGDETAVISVRGQFSSQDYHGIDTIVFDDGTTWRLADIALRATYVGTDGRDDLIGSVYADPLKGGAGFDSLYGGVGGDTYIWAQGDGDDIITEEEGLASDTDTLKLVDVLASEVTLVQDGDSLHVEIGQEVLSVDDQFEGPETAIERIVFADGTTWDAAAIVAHTAVRGTSGDDWLDGSSRADNFIGGAGDDELAGYEGADHYYYSAGDGADTLSDSGEDPVEKDIVILDGIPAAAASVTLNGADAVISLTAGGSITLRDQFAYALGLSEDAATSGIEEVRFMDGAWTRDQLLATALDQAGYTALLGTDTSETLSGTATSDAILGADGDDVLAGDGGADLLVGGGGGDELTGGPGADALRGGAGADHYLFAAGDGADVIIDTADGDQLELGAGILAIDVAVMRSGEFGEDAVLLLGGSDQVTLTGQFGEGAGVSSILFDDTTVWDTGALKAAYLTQHTTSGDDDLRGFVGEDLIEGSAGDDTLRGDFGSDSYTYGLGDGDDVIIETPEMSDYEDHNQLIFGPGIAAADLLLSRNGGGDLTITFDDAPGSVKLLHQFGDDLYAVSGVQEVVLDDATVWSAADLQAAYLSQATTAGNDMIYGSFAGETLSGGEGDDTLYGAAGADNYVYNLGDGDDAIFETWADDTNVLTFGAGIEAADVKVSRTASGATITFDGHAGSVYLDQQFQRGVQEIHFADATVWDTEDLQAAYLLTAQTSGDDEVFGTDGDDTFEGGLGNDIIHPEGWSDTFIYNLGDGDDIILKDPNDNFGGDTNILVFGSGIDPDDVVVARSGLNLVISFASGPGSIFIPDQFVDTGGSLGGIQEIHFVDATVWDSLDLQAAYLENAATSGEDFIYGSEADEDFESSDGDDVVYGGGGADTFHYSAEQGVDIIFTDLVGTDWGLDSQLVLGAGLNAADVVVTRNGDDAVLTFDGLDGAIILNRQFLSTGGDDNTTVVGGVQEIVFGDSTVWSAPTLASHAVAGLGTANDDAVVGSVGSDYIALSAGDDTADGGEGSDSYFFNRADGHDTLADSGATGVDRLFLSPDLTSVGVTIERDTASPNDIRLVFGDEVVTLSEVAENAGSGAGVDQIVFADGTHWDQETLVAAYITRAGTFWDDTIVGFSSDDTFRGDTGDDQLHGLGGQDILIGNEGDDVLDGGEGSDQATYFGSSADFIAFRNADGTVTVVDQVGGEGTDILSDIELLYFVGDDTGFGIDNLVGPYGSNSEDVIFGSASDDNLYGLGGDDVIMGLGGDDRIYGGDGEDLAEYSGNLSDYAASRNADGTVHIEAVGTSEGVDILKDIEAFYFETSETWVQTSQFVGDYGTSGNDAWLAGTERADSLYGLAGDDELMGYDEDDVIDGGDGADQADYLGAYTDYTITHNLDGSVSVVDTIGSDGHDRLWSVESVYFIASDTWVGL